MLTGTYHHFMMFFRLHKRYSSHDLRFPVLFLLCIIPLASLGKKFKINIFVFTWNFFLYKIFCTFDVIYKLIVHNLHLYSQYNTTKEYDSFHNKWMNESLDKISTRLMSLSLENSRRLDVLVKFTLFTLHLYIEWQKLITRAQFSSHIITL